MTPELRWLSDPTVFAVNRLDAHSDHLCCRTLDEAESGLTSLRQSLDGAWRFAWSANPAARPADFWQPDADLSGFGTIRVPAHRAAGLRSAAVHQHPLPVGWPQLPAPAAGRLER